VNAAKAEREMSWVLKEASKADACRSRIVLENPRIKAALDERIMGTYWPMIVAEIKKTDFPCMPASAADVTLESEWLGPDLARRLVFMLFDYVGWPFLRCALRCSESGYILERTFSLGLPESTDHAFLVRILGDERFAGYPPELNVERPILHPEWNTFFVVNLNAGHGLDSRSWTIHDSVMTEISRTISDSCEMYEMSMIDGFHTMEAVEEFLKTAYRCFGSE
jgi:hypothetical protein